MSARIPARRVTRAWTPNDRTRISIDAMTGDSISVTAYWETRAGTRNAEQFLVNRKALITAVLGEGVRALELDELDIGLDDFMKLVRYFEEGSK